MTKVNSSGAHRHLQELEEKLVAWRAKAFEAALLAAAESVLSRTPTVDEEYAELNAPAGEQPFVPRAGDGSADEGDNGRRRFLKPENTYLRNLIFREENRSLADPSKFKFGSITFLEDNTYFKFKNATKNSGSGEEHTVHNYFNRFEGGASGDFVVTPRGNYPLRPGIERITFTRAMNKSIKGRFMYGSPDLLQHVKEAIRAEFQRLTSE